MVQDNIPAFAAAGYTLLSELDDLTWDSWLSLADVATAMNTKAASQGAIFANSFTNTYLKYSGIALVFNHANLTAANAAAIFNEAGLTAANSAAIFNEAGFTFANKALLFREAGLSIANINAIIIHANITDDNAQQILSEITKANRDLTSAANIYEILDDWDDNKLTGRDGAGATATGFTNLFAHKGLFRPEWTTEAGAPSAGGGVMTLPASARVSVSSTFDVGTWECLMVAVSGGHHSFFLQSGGADKYECRRLSNATIGLYDWVDSVWCIGTVGCQDETIASIIKMTRDGSSGWEIFENGVSKGTVTDSTTTSFDELHLDATSQSSNFDNLKVY